MQERNTCLCIWQKDYSWQPCMAQTTVFLPTHCTKSRMQDSRLALYYLAQLCHPAVKTVSICCRRTALFLFQMASSKAALQAPMHLARLLSGSGQRLLTATWCLRMRFSKSRRIMRQVQAMMFSLIPPISTVTLLWQIFVQPLLGNRSPGPSLISVPVMLTSALWDSGCP